MWSSISLYSGPAVISQSHHFPVHFIRFADDTRVFFFSHKSLTLLSMTVNSELITISDRFRANTQSLNLKNNFDLFRSHSKIVTLEKFSLLFDNILLTQVISSNFIGVYVDEHLTWNEHTNNIPITIAKNIGVISRIDYLLPSTICFAIPS